jgi:hypothetical protein
MFYGDGQIGNNTRDDVSKVIKSSKKDRRI